MDQLDLQRLQDLLEILGTAGVLRFSVGDIHVEFPPPAPQAASLVVESPDRPEIDSPKSDAPSAYARLLGPNLPQWERLREAR